jgi:ribosome maturation factor RimP
VKGTRHEELLTALEEVTRDVVMAAGLELVELSLRGPSRRRLLRVDIDREGPRGVDIDDCQRVSVALGEALESAGLLEDSYVLEVSSPGLDRPIVSPEDFRRNTGRRVIIRTRENVGARRQWRGVLLGLEEDRVRVRDDEVGEVVIGVEQLESARQDVEF